ncbi:Oidioi.mRNA.OKI2018_I69.chr1.g2943.t1.cds [Oikopleura dioica]|uniref:Oidioi.mRNA.OKI2018_I69.chr1.g2943.t1.cds n=1 Tax=Oikopleura dioica TaxID=34765 RepID=A0ABN7SW51_OIKDI|nr:Oidioi.mRNA.OKI2018_I69.chr1.g2943.t1.cds [Oikopleura dioica]
MTLRSPPKAVDDDTDVSFLKFLKFLRVLRFARIVRLIVTGTGAARQQVGQNKRRYQKDGFDLDLTYITEKCIAMSFPSEGRQAMFRNPMPEVSRFLKTKHAGKFYVYNLCAERGYEGHWFDNQNGRVFVDDHNVPKLEELVEWGVEAKKWTDKGDDYVIAVHCKGGKGRTGTFIASWLLITDFCPSADVALRHFGERRTDESKGTAFQGVETPSQSRYVNYYESILRSGWPKRKRISIDAFTIQNISPIGRGNGRCIYFTIVNFKKVVLEAAVLGEQGCTVALDRQNDRCTIHLKTPLVVKDDVKFMFYSSEKSVPRNYEDCAFYFWIHTAFMPASGHLTLERHELDNPHKSKTWKHFTDGFSCTIHAKILDN